MLLAVFVRHILHAVRATGELQPCKTQSTGLSPGWAQLAVCTVCYWSHILQLASLSSVLNPHLPTKRMFGTAKQLSACCIACACMRLVRKGMRCRHLAPGYRRSLNSPAAGSLQYSLCRPLACTHLLQDSAGHVKAPASIAIEAGFHGLNLACFPERHLRVQAVTALWAG